jgi:hypothetical protein
MENRWKDISYLKYGTKRQQQAYKALKDLKVLEIMKPYNPTLVGTIPINIDISNSDLDIICEVYNFAEFEKLIINSFSKYNEFTTMRKKDGNLLASISSFNYGGFMIEIFGQSKPVTKQNAYRHMEVEAKLLELFGEGLRKEIVKLKELGLKTEPAFAKYFNIKGDPYEEMLKLSELSKDELLKLI